MRSIECSNRLSDRMYPSIARENVARSFKVSAALIVSIDNREGDDLMRTWRISKKP